MLRSHGNLALWVINLQGILHLVARLPIQDQFLMLLVDPTTLVLFHQRFLALEVQQGQRLILDHLISMENQQRDHLDPSQAE
jgi:hypothetical protein